MLGKKPLGVWLTVALALVAILGLPAAANALVSGTASVTVNPSSVSFGAVVPLNISVTANDDAGKNSEYWIVVTDPANNKYSYNGSAWVSGLSIFGSGPLANFSTVVNTSALNAAGTYTVEILVDFTVNGTMDYSSVYDSTTITVSAQQQVAPTLKVTVNGSDNPTVVIGDTSAIRLQMNPGTYSGKLAEWWIVVVFPDNTKQYYKNDSLWYPAVTAYNWQPVISVDATIVSPPLTIPGKYTVYWGMDDTYDGNVNLVVWDTATITVPGTLPSADIMFHGTNGVDYFNPAMWTGGTVDFDVSLIDGDYGSMDAQMWILCVKPDGQTVYYDIGAPAWGTAKKYTDDTLTNLVAAATGASPITSPVMDQYGVWTYYLVVDGTQNTSIDFDYFIYDKVKFYVGTDPQVEVSPSQASWDKVVDAATPLMIYGYVYPGLYESSYADLWVVAVSPVGVYSSLKYVDGWVSGIDYFHQIQLSAIPAAPYGAVVGNPDPKDIDGTHENWYLVEVDVTDQLKTIAGSWTVYFGVDKLNGYVDSNILYATTKVTITD